MTPLQRGIEPGQRQRGAQHHDGAARMAAGKFGGRGKWFEEVKRRLSHRIESTRQVLLASVKAPIGTRCDLSKSRASRENEMTPAIARSR